MKQRNIAQILHLLLYQRNLSLLLIILHIFLRYRPPFRLTFGHQRLVAYLNIKIIVLLKVRFRRWWPFRWSGFAILSTLAWESRFALVQLENDLWAVHRLTGHKRLLAILYHLLGLGVLVLFKLRIIPLFRFSHVLFRDRPMQHLLMLIVLLQQFHIQFRVINRLRNCGLLPWRILLFILTFFKSSCLLNIVFFLNVLKFAQEGWVTGLLSAVLSHDVRVLAT